MRKCTSESLQSRKKSNRDICKKKKLHPVCCSVFDKVNEFRRKEPCFKLLSPFDYFGIIDYFLYLFLGCLCVELHFCDYFTTEAACQFCRLFISELKMTKCYASVILNFFDAFICLFSGDFLIFFPSSFQFFFEVVHRAKNNAVIKNDFIQFLTEIVCVLFREASYPYTCLSLLWHRIFSCTLVQREAPVRYKRDLSDGKKYSPYF